MANRYLPSYTIHTFAACYSLWWSIAGRMRVVKTEECCVTGRKDARIMQRYSCLSYCSYPAERGNNCRAYPPEIVIQANAIYLLAFSQHRSLIALRTPALLKTICDLCVTFALLTFLLCSASHISKCWKEFVERNPRMISVCFACYSRTSIN